MRIITLLIGLCLIASVCFADASTITITTASTSIVVADDDRTTLLIKNTGTTACFLTDEATATTSDFELGVDEVYIANERHSKKAINGITSSGTTTVAIWTGKS